VYTKQNAFIMLRVLYFQRRR